MSYTKSELSFQICVASTQYPRRQSSEEKYSETVFLKESIPGARFSDKVKLFSCDLILEKYVAEI